MKIKQSYKYDLRSRTSVVEENRTFSWTGSNTAQLLVAVSMLYEHYLG